MPKICDTTAAFVDAIAEDIAALPDARILIACATPERADEIYLAIASDRPDIRLRRTSPRGHEIETHHGARIRFAVPGASGRGLAADRVLVEPDARRTAHFAAAVPCEFGHSRLVS